MKNKQLRSEEIPQEYININYYLDKYLGKLPDPSLNPGTKKPVGPEDLLTLFPKALVEQEVSLKEKIAIPDEVMDRYATYRTTPLIRAYNLEKYLETSSRIYFKYEGVSPAGSHKLNTALPQAYFNKLEGVKRLVTETGAGQWGTALSMACSFFDLECLVYMVKISFEQKPYRKVLMDLFGANVISSPSKTTKIGNEFLKKSPQTHGSLGMAIAEAIEVVVQNDEFKYSLGSVLNHVLLHQTIIGQEVKNQFMGFEDSPDVVVGCCGGGSNFSGIAFPYLASDLEGGNRDRRYVAVEPESCPSLSKGEYRYDFGDSGKQTPLMKMKTLGSDFVPSPVHAGGLRYHGVAPQIAFLHEEGLIESQTFDQNSIFAAAQLLAQTEGLVVAPESAHAVASVIAEAKENRGEAIVGLISGHGLLDLSGYEDYLSGNLS